MASSDRIPCPKPLELQGNMATNWQKFHRQWSNYEIAAKLTAETEKIRIATLFTVIGTEAMDLYDGFNMEENSSLADIIIAFESFCKGRENESYERFVFNSRNQKEGETIERYVAQLRKHAKTCNFGDLADSLIRDRIIMGITCEATRRKLLQESKLTLTKCIDIVRTMEQSKKQLATIQGETSELNRVSLKAGRKKETTEKFSAPPFQARSKPTSSNKKSTIVNCKFCGRDHEPVKVKCPAYGKLCSHCKKKNHFAAKCKSKQTVRCIEESYSEDSDDTEYLLTVEQTKASFNSSKATALLHIGAKQVPVRFLLDTGATVNTVARKFVKANDIKQTKTKTLTMWNHSIAKPLGEVTYPTKNPKTGQISNITYIVVDNNLTCLLGLHAAQLFDLVELKERNYIAQIQETQNGLGTASLKVDPDVSPRVLPCRRVPIALKEKVKSKLDELVNRGILVPETEPTEWVSQMTIVEKSNKDIRICIDPQPLNQALMREHYKLPTLEDITHELHNAKYFSKLDVEEAYWHIRLDEKSSKLTTMITPWGRMRWTRLPFGLKVSSEIFQQRLTEALQGLPGCHSVADDILICGKSESKDDAESSRNHDENLKLLQDRCKEKGIKLNKQKSEFKKTELKFHGHIISTSGMKPDPDKVKAIAEMPAPTDVPGIRRFCGMINYLAKYIPNLSQTLDPLRALTKKHAIFRWTDECQKAFESAKKFVVDATLLSFYDPDKPLILQVDSSQSGIGIALLQEGKPIEFASKAMTDCQKKWAQIEKELLAVVVGLEKFDQYTYGRTVIVENDHKPLRNILNKPISQAPRRLQNLMIRMNRYDAVFKYVQGTELKIADTLSRAISKHSDCHQIEDNVVNHIEIRDNLLEEIKSHTENDHILQEMKTFILNGWPDRKAVRHELQPFYNQKDIITLHDDLLMMGNRVIIPKSLRSKIKDRLHSAHLGYDAMIRRARSTVYWPGINQELKQTTQNCESCQVHKSANIKEPLHQHNEGKSPWEKVGIDFFELENRNYMAMVDYYSNFIEIEHMTSTTTSHTISKLKSQFARHGVPKQLVSDCGPQLTSEQFKNFTDDWKIIHKKSSPHYHQSNGKAEAAVKSIKKLIKKTKHAHGDIFKALLEHRNTPRQDTNLSPAEMLFQRSTRSMVPKLHDNQTDKNIIQQKRTLRQKSVERYYNKTAKHLPKLTPGQAVYFLPFNQENTWRRGTIVTRHNNDRSYDIECNGKTFTRNRRHINPAFGMPAKDNTDMPIYIEEESIKPSPEQQDSRRTSPLKAPQRERDLRKSPKSQAEFPNSPPKEVEPKLPLPTPSHHTQNPKAHYKTRSGRVVKRPNKYTE